jgi:hypothetical protein
MVTKHGSLLPIVVSFGLLGACSSETAGVTYTLIDDMEGANVTVWTSPGGATPGGWYTSTDCTQADRILPPPYDIDPNGWSYDELGAPHETMPGVESRRAARLRTIAPLAGIWGATLGLNFVESVLRDGHPPLPPAPGPGCGLTSLDFMSGTVDVSAYSGITFWARAASPGLRTVRVNFRDRNTDPRDGLCNAADLTKTDDCYNDFGTAVILTDTFTRYTIDFSSLTQKEGWGFRPEPNVPDLQHVYTLGFQVDLPYCPPDGPTMCAGGEMQSYTFDFEIDDLYFQSSAP